MPWELDQIMGKELAQIGLHRLKLNKVIASAMKPKPASPFGKIATLETVLYMRNQLLRDADWAGMAHSLEIRVPLVDVSLHKSLAGLLNPGEMNSKQLLACSPEIPLPASIAERAKTGFTTPIEKWQIKSNGEQKAHGSWARQWALSVLVD